MPYISARHLTRASGQHNFKLDKKQGNQKKQDDAINKLAIQRGLHSGNRRKKLLAEAIAFVASTMVFIGGASAVTAERSHLLRLKNNIRMADARTHQNKVARAVFNEIERQRSGGMASKPDRHATSSDQSLALNVLAPLPPRSARSVPLRPSVQSITTITPTPLDDVKIVKLPRYVIKKINSFNDAFASISKGGAHPFQSLITMLEDIYSLESYKEIDPNTKKTLNQIGGVIDDITALIPDVNLTRIPFKMSQMMSRSDTPPNADELTGLLNDVNALKGYIKQETFPVTHAKPQKGEKSTTMLVTDRNGKTHSLPVSWYKKNQLPNGGEWKIPLKGYRASKKEMLIEQDNGLYSSLNNQDFIKIKKHFYPVEFVKGQPDNAFIINPNERNTLPVEREPGNSLEWRVVHGMRSSKDKPDTPNIEWEHRLASASTSHALELAVPDVTTGIATIEGEEYIKGNYGVYKIEYNNDISSYVVKTGDGLDYPISFNKDTFSWETKIMHTKAHRYTSGKFKLLDNRLKKSMIEQELRRRDVSERLRYPVSAGEVIKLQGSEYLFEADGFTELRSVSYDKYVQLMRGIKGVEQNIKFALEAIAQPDHPQVRKVISEHFAIPESAITSKLLKEVKSNLLALQSGILWLRRGEFSIMTLNNMPGVRGRYDGCYLPEYNKVVAYDIAFQEGKEAIEHMINHELCHHSITDPKHPFRTTVDSHYRPRHRGEHVHKSLSKEERAGITYDDGGENFMRRMKANNLGMAWETYDNDPKLRIRTELENPDSITDLTKGLAKVVHPQEIPAGDRRKRNVIFGGR